MFITAKAELPVLQVVEVGEGEKKKAAVKLGGVFPLGCHEVERIPNPVCIGGPCWLVLKGTKIGHAQDVWHTWRNRKKRGDRAVLITEQRPAPTISASTSDDGPATLPASEDSFTSGPGESERGPHPDAVPPSND